MREYFFGKEASTDSKKKELESQFGNYEHYTADIRNFAELEKIFKAYGKFDIIVHTAAQPSHDWAAKEPLTDFYVNAVGTINLLELTRLYCKDAVFIHCSTSKVYGDNPNKLPFKQLETRWDIDANIADYPTGRWPSIEKGASWNGIAENFSIDNCLHSLFGASKTSGDLVAQEYGKYFGMNVGIFRPGCLTGGRHAGTELHGFLSYLVKCAATNRLYNIFGYKGKQVRSNIHSYDLLNAFWEFYLNPKHGEVYNIDGGRDLSCSILEAIDIATKVTGNKFKFKYVDENRIGDHRWFIADISKFKKDYPNWKLKYNTIESIIQEIYDTNKDKWLNV
jgi:CDP-paratose 2-epimerase